MIGSEEYYKAYKMGRKEMAARQAKGESPYLQVLDEIPGAAESVMEYSLGLVQIPTDRIVGTKTLGRSQAFAANFMPIMDPKTEFADKWAHLCNSHLEEGIHDSIVAYEYMNYFYVLEGNKRVSVLKYFDAVSIQGTVTRIVPYRTDQKENKIYYEFMDFYRLAEINYIWFSEEGRFAKLQYLVGKRPDEVWTDDDKLEFSSLYTGFEAAYLSKEKEKKGATVGDAFLDFIEIYGYDSLRTMTTAELKERIAKTKAVFEALSEEGPEIKMDPAKEKSSLIQRLIPVSSPVQKIAFVHEVDPRESGWTYAHDLGRMHLEQTFSNQLDVSVYIASEYPSYEDAVRKAAEEKNDIIFTTSPVLYNASLKVALDHKDVRILNCSLMSDKGVIRTYSARMYEAKFLLGAIAGAMAENDRLGYLADYPVYGTPANINAFALGAKMVNPRAKVYVEWESRKNTDYYGKFREYGVSVVSGRNIIIPGKNQGSRHFGIFVPDEQTPHNLAMPVCHWGRFYEQIIRSIMSGSWKSEDKTGQKSLNYWWGMKSGVVEVICSQNLPVGTVRLVELLKKTICEAGFNPFSGILYSQTGVIQGMKHETLIPERIITMDWLCENVIGEIPKMSELTEHARPVVLQQGVSGKEEE